MRIIFVGASNKAIMTAKELAEKNHDLLVIEIDQEVIERLEGTVDCNFIKGDGTQPEVLKETDPGSCDILFCLTGNDHSNVIAGLVGKSLGIKKVVVSIKDAIWKNICNELGLENTIIPNRLISRFLINITEGYDLFNLKDLVRGEAHLFSFVAKKEDEKSINELDLPSESKVVWLYREGKFQLVDETTKVKEKDEVVVATEKKNIDKLRERWGK